MIVSQTPFRVSFAGGGTDLPAYYQEESGAVLSVTIKRHMYVTVHRRFEPSIRVAYTKTEMAANVDQIEHELVREALRKLGIDEPLEITTIADVPAGTGLGSSSALTVGLLSALSAYKGHLAPRDQLARDACEIEIDTLGHPIGRQDQYAAAYGGMNYIRFNPDHSVVVEPVPLLPATQHELEARALLLYTEKQRSAGDILQKQSAGTSQNRGVLTAMRDLADALRSTLTGATDIERFIELLHEGWQLKRSLGFGISDEQIDTWYDAALKTGAQGGKLLGAGGGGFLLLFAPPERHEAIRAALGRPRELPFEIERAGSRIVFISECR